MSVEDLAHAVLGNGLISGGAPVHTRSIKCTIPMQNFFLFLFLLVLGFELSLVLAKQALYHILSL
jgi:hypothetical protein